MSTDKVKPKKYLGQHFLKDENIAQKIAMLPKECGYDGPLMEIGPGMGVLTKYILNEHELTLCEIDSESVVYIKKHYPDLKVIEGDFLQLNLNDYYQEPFGVIGNFPYNISSQIVFKILDNKELIPFACGMFQREMAQRIASIHGSKEYGIISVLTQTYYEVKYHFTVSEGVFQPPPKVKSGVISMKRIPNPNILDEKLFKNVVKTAFNQRRKTMRNSIRSLITDPEFLKEEIFNKRPEELSVAEFHELSNQIFKLR
ncbi:MAG: 16S rRNA (adenine(1518)-N(6)/adenine(1519)-N(6))-dimethyltransferase RsmA [Bacteroidetes bacterium]|nr:16S rRNA (adenine(1518)-N(6)/adenine(1519)-N(6))-dimethyltransferase RsmA [Bacteroidota bacterium]